MTALAIAYFSRSEPTVHPVRLALTPAEKTTAAANLTVSPDGLTVAFIANNAEGKRELWVRPLAADTPQVLAGTEDAETPFWSADSRSLGFFANGKLFKVDAARGRPQALCDVRDVAGGTWNRDGVIVFSGTEGLYRVSAQGGTPELATKVDPKEEAHRWPSFLPDGRHFVFLADAQTTENHHIRLGSLDSQETEILFGAVTRVVYAPPGYLLYVNQGALVAHPFDAKSLNVTGDPITVAEHIAEVGFNHDFDFSVSDNGVLAYQIGGTKSQLAWFDRTGKKLESVGAADNYATLALSPDGARAVAGLLDTDGRQADVWIIDLSRGTKSRLTFDPQSDGDPTWSPDGKRIMFTSNRTNDGHIHLYETSANTTADNQLLLRSDADDIPMSWSPDSTSVLFLRFKTTARATVWLLSVADRQAKPLLESQAFDYGSAEFSPNGRFIAYDSNESGRNEVYVQTFPPSGQKWVISNGGGSLPLWRRDGKELFYLTQDGKVMSAEMKSDSTFDSVVTKQLFQTQFKRAPGIPYAVTNDGSRFLINTPAEANTATPLVVVLNWTATLKAKE